MFVKREASEKVRLQIEERWKEGGHEIKGDDREVEMSVNA